MNALCFVFKDHVQILLLRSLAYLELFRHFHRYEEESIHWSVMSESKRDKLECMYKRIQKHNDTILDLQPTSAIAWYQKAVTFLEWDAWNDAIGHFQEAYRLDPNLWQAYLGKLIALFMSKDIVAAKFFCYDIPVPVFFQHFDKVVTTVKKRCPQSYIIGM